MGSWHLLLWGSWGQRLELLCSLYGPGLLLGGAGCGKGPLRMEPGLRGTPVSGADSSHEPRPLPPHSRPRPTLMLTLWTGHGAQRMGTALWPAGQVWAPFQESQRREAAGRRKAGRSGFAQGPTRARVDSAPPPAETEGLAAHRRPMVGI